MLWRNPIEFFGQSGRLLVDPDLADDGSTGTDASATFEGNSILRGSRD